MKIQYDTNDLRIDFERKWKMYQSGEADAQETFDAASRYYTAFTMAGGGAGGETFREVYLDPLTDAVIKEQKLFKRTKL